MLTGAVLRGTTRLKEGSRTPAFFMKVKKQPMAESSSAQLNGANGAGSSSPPTRKLPTTAIASHQYVHCATSFQRELGPFNEQLEQARQRRERALRSEAEPEATRSSALLDQNRTGPSPPATRTTSGATKARLRRTRRALAWRSDGPTLATYSAACRTKPRRRSRSAQQSDVLTTWRCS